MATQTERREATRKSIVGAARKLFGKNGFAATSVDDLAAAASVAKGAVYHHFPTKEAVFEAVFEEASGELARHVASTARSARDALEAMVIGTSAYFEACAQRGMAQVVLRDGPAVLGWERWREIDERHFGQTIPSALKAAMAAGIINRQPVEPLSRLLIGAITEAAAACSASADPSAEGRRFATAMRTLLEGLRR